MGLASNAVNGRSCREEVRNNPQDAPLLGPGCLDVEVVVIELRNGVCSFGGLESDGEKRGSQDAMEDRISVRPVLFERLIDHVPCVALPSVVPSDVGNVGLDDACQLCGCPGSGRHYSPLAEMPLMRRQANAPQEGSC